MDNRRDKNRKKNSLVKKMMNNYSESLTPFEAVYIEILIPPYPVSAAKLMYPWISSQGSQSKDNPIE